MNQLMKNIKIPAGFLMTICLSISQIAFADPQLTSTIKFSHQTHSDLTPAKCSTCHDLTSKNPYPSMDTCGKCHGAVNATADKYCLSCHTTDDYNVTYPKDAREVDPDSNRMWTGIRSNFNHLSNSHKNMNCTTCHTKIMQSQNATDDNFPKRADCGKCHKVVDTGNPHDCVMCHQITHNSAYMNVFLKKAPPHSL